MNIPGYTMVGPLCYQGKAGCEYVGCRRMVNRKDDGSYTFGPCMGYHCSYCDEPCGSQGHRCPASQALLDASSAIIAERSAEGASTAPESEAA